MNPNTSATPPPSAPRRRRRRWRRLLLWTIGVVVALAAAFAGVFAWLYARADTSTFGDLDFVNELAIPPLLEPETDEQGRQVFSLELQAGVSEFKPEMTTETWGVNGAYLGPTLRASRGDDVVVNVRNELPESTTVHWHGMHLPAVADGNPHSPIDAGATWSPSWTIDQPAATLWYHPHLMGSTADHVYRGVAGLFLLDDDNTPAELPDRYGVDDIPVIIQDKRFDGDGSLDAGAPFLSQVGQLGNEILVNGTHDPHVAVADESVRFRMLNASNARVYNLGFDDDRQFQLVGTDGGLLEAPDARTRIQVSPGERVELVARFAPGERAVLRSYPPDLGTGSLEGRFSGGDDRFDLLQVRAAAELAPSPELPDGLVDDTLPDASAATTSRQFELNGSSRINGQRMDMTRVDTVVAVDTTEIWEVTNGSGNPHSFHVHDVQFRVLEYDGQPPPAHLTGAKDTVYLPPRVTARLVLSFTDYTDPETPYMLHCHFLRHEDSGMMAQFTVVKADQVDDAPRRLDAHRHDS